MLGLLLLVAAAAALTRAQEYRCILTEQYDPSTGLCVDVQTSTTSAQIGSSYASRAKCTYGQCEARTFDESEDQCATPADCPDDGRTSEWLCNDGECRPYSCVFPYVAAYGQCMLWEPTPAPSADYCLVGEVYVDGTCVDLQNDPQNCGELEFSCYSSDAINSRCLAGRCFGECPYTGLNRRYYRDRRCWSATEMNGPQCAWTQEWDGETCVNVATDHENCGSIGAYCPYSSELENGYSDCVAGVCEFTCVDGYRPVANECVENYPVLVAAASQRARARRRSLSLQTACPRGETACPLYGASSEALERQDLAGMHRAGFECIDTSSALESCGGCASMDDKHDCTAIEHANAVSCVESECVVYSCQHGFVPNEAQSACVQDDNALRRKRAARR